MRDLGDRGGDIADTVADRRGPDRSRECALGRLDEPEVFVAGRSDDEGHGGVGDPSVDRCGEVERDEVAVAECVVERQAVQHGVVDGGAEDLSERHRAERGVVVDVARLRPCLADEVVSVTVDVEQIRPDARLLAQRREGLRDESSRGAHRLDLGRGAQLDHRVPSVSSILAGCGGAG